MMIETVKDLLLWCGVINYGILLFWAGIFIFAHDWIYGIHSRWFNLTPEQFDMLNYSMMGIYKLMIFIFNLVPFFALLIVM